MPQDWFTQNAPAQPQQDWFAANSPKEGQQQKPTTAGTGKTGARLKGTPAGLPDTFMGTITKDFAGVPEAGYKAVRHPYHTASGVLQGIKNLPHDLEQDLKDGKYGKLSARALELIIPALSSEKAMEIAQAADMAAGRTAARIAGSAVPEAIGAELKQTLTPGIVQRIRERLAKAKAEPTPAPTTPVQPFRPNPNIAKRMGKAPGGLTAEEIGGVSRPSPKGRLNPPGAGKPSSGTGAALVSTADASKLAQYLKSGGITKAEAKMMDAGDWQLAAHGAGLSAAPSEGTVKLALDQLWENPSAPIKVRRRMVGR
jgi:hypothetical protein